MQKRNLDINYGNTNEEELDEGYTFIIPNDKYKNININYKTEKDTKKETKKRDEIKKN